MTYDREIAEEMIEKLGVDKKKGLDFDQFADVFIEAEINLDTKVSRYEAQLESLEDDIRIVKERLSQAISKEKLNEHSKSSS